MTEENDINSSPDPSNIESASHNRVIEDMAVHSMA